MHQFGTFDAVDTAIIALQHPGVLLVGASGNGGPMGRFEFGAFAALTRDGPRKEEQADEGRRTD